MRSPLLRILVASLALAGALAAQQATAATPYDLAGWGAYFLASVVFALGVWAPSVPSVATESLPQARPAGGVVLRLGAALFAVVALVAAIGFSETSLYPWTSLALWLVATAAAALAVRRWQVAPGLAATPPWNRNELLGVLAIAGLAAVARFTWIDAIPYHIIGDEPRVASQIYRYYHTELRSFFQMGWNTWPNLGMALQGIFTPVLGIHTTTLKMSSALAGTFAVVTTYILSRELLSRRVAVFVAILFAICRTAIDFSRLGVCHAQVMLWGSLALALWFRGLNTGKALTFFFSGFVLGLNLYSYNAGQSFPPLLFSWIAISAVMRPSAIRTHWKAAGLVGAGFLLCTSPLIYHITDHFQFLHNWVEWTHMARNRQVVAHIMDVWNMQGWPAAKALVYHQVFGTALGFTAIPAGAYGIGYRGGGLLDHISSPLFVLGMAILFTRLFRREAILLYWFFVNAIIGSVLTDDPPATVRMVGLVPTLPIMAGLALSSFVDLWAGIKALRAVGIGVAALLLSLAGYDVWRTYFVEYAATEPDGATDLARRFDDLPKDTIGRLLGAEYFLRFGDELFDINFMDHDLENVDEPAHFLPVHSAMGQPLVVVLAPTQFGLMPYLKSLYPHAELFDLATRHDKRMLYRMATIPVPDLLAHTGLVMNAGDEPASVADPFDSTVARAGAIEWTGQVYWPAVQPGTLKIASGRGGELVIGDKVRRKLGAGEKVQEPVDLPVGWHPITLREPPGGTRSLSLVVEAEKAKGEKAESAGQPVTLDRWAMRPDTQREGLHGIYKRDGEVLLQRIDPQLNTFLIENFWELPRFYLQIRAPFDVEWNGKLRVPTTGSYAMKVDSSGAYSIEIDGEVLCSADHILPEEPKQCTTTRQLTQGTHTLRARWACRATPSSNRRLFQLSWTPPGGVQEIIPPTQFEP